jgi:prepilin-type processing-associated H-X9-DG protein
MSSKLSFRRFTMIELLVVIAVIGLITALLLPALSRAKAQALTAKCQSNLRQIAVAMTAYMSEHKGLMPHPDADTTISATYPEYYNYCWYDRLDEVYMGHVDILAKQCPADDQLESTFYATGQQHSIKMNVGQFPGMLDTDVVWNGSIRQDEFADLKKKSQYFPRLSLIKNAGELVMMFDGDSDGAPGAPGNDPSGGPGTTEWARHNEVVNFLMFDGSVHSYFPPASHRQDETLNTDDPTLHGVNFTYRSKR